MQAAEKRALEAEQKLCDVGIQLDEAEQRSLVAEERADAAEQKAQLAEERAKLAEQATDIAHRRVTLAEENGSELERRLYEAESHLEELLEYKELLHATQRLSSLESATAQQELCSSSNESLKLLRHSNNSLNDYFVTYEQKQDVQSLNECCPAESAGDNHSITSL